uniref:Uncharacterized protein n=1 Tax=Octopus bimaculoides TaxID=37653 RepID=A0A0L8FUJ1_OCTBM
MLFFSTHRLQMCLFVTKMTFGFFERTVCRFVGFSTSVAFLLVCGIRLLMVLLRTLILVLLDLVDLLGFGTVDSFFSNLCCVFSLDGNSDSMGKI